jgi:hypothetical protein
MRMGGLQGGLHVEAEKKSNAQTGIWTPAVHQRWNCTWAEIASVETVAVGVVSCGVSKDYVLAGSVSGT